MLPELVPFLRQTVTVEPKTSLDRFGVASYGTAVSHRARVVGRRRLVRTQGGEEVVSMHTVYLATNRVVGGEDRVTLSTGRDLVLVTAEEPHSTPWIPTVPDSIAACGDADGDGTATVLGARTWRAGAVTDEVLALCHPHVRWMAWVPEVDR